MRRNDNWNGKNKRKLYKELFVNKFNNVQEMDKFWETYSVPELK